jgi:thiol-disulfide isomerase/thioredoxin
MIWGEDEANSKGKQSSELAANATSSNNISFQEFDHLAAEVRLLREELQQLRESQEKQNPLQGATAKSIDHSGKVLLFFTATWCGPCQQMNPIIKRLQSEGLPIRSVDVDEEPDVAKQFGVSSIPHFQLVIAGKPASGLSGITTEKELRKLVNTKWTPIDPVRDDHGRVSGKHLSSAAPADGLITDAKSLQKLCRDWKLKTRDFDIDFSRQFLTVATAPGSSVSITFKKDEMGNLTGAALATLDTSTNSFSYCIAVMNRDGIRSYNGKAIPAEEENVYR